MAGLVIKLKKTLSEALPPSPRKPPPNYDLVHSKVTLQALGLTLGDKILVGGVKVSYPIVIAFCGGTRTVLINFIDSMMILGFFTLTFESIMLTNILVGPYFLI